MSHRFLARIIHGGVELCLLKIFQEITDRNQIVLNHLLLLIEELLLLGCFVLLFYFFFFFLSYFEDEVRRMGAIADPFGRSCDLSE